MLPSVERIGKTPATSMNQVLSLSGGARIQYSDVTCASFEKRYKFVVKSRTNQSAETIKNVLKTKINPTSMKVAAKTLKSLKDGRVLIEVGSIGETNLLSTNISALWSIQRSKIT